MGLGSWSQTCRQSRQPCAVCKSGLVQCSTCGFWNWNCDFVVVGNMCVSKARHSGACDDILSTKWVWEGCIFFFFVYPSVLPGSLWSPLFSQKMCMTFVFAASALCKQAASCRVHGVHHVELCRPSWRVSRRGSSVVTEQFRRIWSACRCELAVTNKLKKDWMPDKKVFLSQELIVLREGTGSSSG